MTVSGLIKAHRELREEYHNTDISAELVTQKAFNLLSRVNSKMAEVYSDQEYHLLSQLETKLNWLIIEA